MLSNNYKFVDGFICQSVRHDYISGNFKDIKECQDWKLQVAKKYFYQTSELNGIDLFQITNHLINNAYQVSEEIVL